MYTRKELIRLGAHKTALRRRISVRRVQCAEAAARVVRPLAWMDRALALWRRISPVAKFAAVPLALAARRVLFPRLKVLGPLLRWGPLAMGVFRGFNRARG